MKPGIKADISELLDQQMQGVLATVSPQGEPALHLMAYAFSASLKRLYIASYGDTLKVSNMRANPRVHWLWDNRTGSPADHVEGFALTAAGYSSELRGGNRQAAAELLLHRNKSLRKLLDSPQVTLFAIDIDRYSWIQGYGKVEDYHPGSVITAD